MASINKKASSPFWWAWFRDANGKQRSRSTEILREPDDSAKRKAAQAIADRFEYEAKNGVPVGTSQAAATQTPGPSVPTFRDYYPHWIAGRGGDKNYHSKLNLYLSAVSDFLAEKSNWPLCRLDTPDFVGLPGFLLNLGYSPTTVTAYLRLVRQAFWDAIDKGFAVVCPIDPGTYLVNDNPNQPVALTIPQIEHLMNVTLAVDWRTTILSGFYLGMDLSEAVNQIWPKIDLAAGTATWVTFNRKDVPFETALPVHPALLYHLRAVKPFAKCEFVAPTLHGLSEAALRAQFSRWLERAGLPIKQAKPGMNRQYHALQFSSLKLTFAEHLGHTGLRGLAPFLRSLARSELEAKVLALPVLQLNALPLLAA